MAGYIGSKASVVSSGAGYKKTFTISTTTTLLTGVTYTVNRVNVFHNGVRLVDGTDYTATNGTSITLTSAAENGDQIVVTSQADFNVANTYTQAEADATFLKPASTLDATKLSGDLPAISGANLTGIAASLSALTDCTVSTADPTISTNPTSGLGHMWINKTSGEQYLLTDATAGSNVWTNVGDGTGDVQPAEYVAATGGTITTDGNFKVHTFTSSGTFEVTNTPNQAVTYLAIAGGGRGGDGSSADYRQMGGAGGGGYLTNTFYPLGGAGNAGQYGVTIGAGGSSAPNGPGSNSSIIRASDSANISTPLGGGGTGQSGGSGGGGEGRGEGTTTTVGGAGTSGQGNSGGDGSVTSTTVAAGGGGGGAYASGADGSGNTGGVGGVGIASSINGTAITRSGGGGGGGTTTGGLGGGGGGGNGGSAASGSAGAVNTGGGGGGAGGNRNNGGAGGSGIIIFRYQFQ